MLMVEEESLEREEKLGLSAPRLRAQAQPWRAAQQNSARWSVPFCSLHTIIQIERLINGHT